jgi:hypothetical protein
MGLSDNRYVALTLTLVLTVMLGLVGVLFVNVKPATAGTCGTSFDTAGQCWTGFCWNQGSGWECSRCSWIHWWNPSSYERVDGCPMVPRDTWPPPNCPSWCSR